MKKIVFLSIAFLLIISFCYGQKTEWKIDKSHTNVQFMAVHMSLSEVNGEFRDYSGTIYSDKENFSDANIEIVIQANSIDTDNEKRDDHLKSEDFLHVEKYPEIKFESSSLKKVEGKKYKMTGLLTIRGITKKEEFDVKYQGTVSAMGNTLAGFKVTGTINRFDYNVDWNKSFAKGLVVSKEIDIDCDVELIKQ